MLIIQRNILHKEINIIQFYMHMSDKFMLDSYSNS